MDVIDGIELLKQTHHRVGDRLDLDFEPVADRDLDRIAQLVPLSTDLRRAYRYGAPAGEFPALSQDSELSRADALTDGLLGYRVHAISGQRLPDWDEAWLVVGGDSGDPLIAHTDRPDTPVSIAVHGAGKWQPLTIADSLGAFYALVATWSSLLLEDFNGERLDPDRDFEVKVGFWDRFHERLGAVLPDHNMAAFRTYLTA